LRSIRFTAGAAAIVLVVGIIPACFDQLGPDPQFPSDGGVDVTTSADGSGDGTTFADAMDDTVPSGPAALLSAAILDFGQVGCGSSPTGPKTLTVANVGSAPLSFSMTLDNLAAFTISPSAGGTIPVGGSTQVTVTALRVPATATAAQTILGGLTIDSNDATQPSQSVRLSVTPTGGTITITPQSIDFGQVPLGSSTTVPVVITNTGNAMVGVQFTQPRDPEFALWAGATLTESVPPGQSLEDGGVPITSITFTPQEGGSSSAPMTIPLGNTCGISPNEIDFMGSASPSGVTGVSATELDFSTPCMGAGTPQTVTITNQATGTLTIAGIAATDGFSATPTGISIPAGQSGIITVAAPAWTTGTSSGPGATGLLTFATSDGALPSVSIPLTETFVGADLSFTDGNGDVLADITYPGVPVGQAQTFPFQVLNTGNAAVTIVPGAVQSPPWSWAIPGSQNVSVQGAAPLSLTFAPTTAGMQSTMVTITTMGAVCTTPGQFTATGTGDGTGGTDSGTTTPDASTLDSSVPDSSLQLDSSAAGD
jgi:hypothetical protein